MEDKTCADCVHSGIDHYSGNLFCFIDDLEILDEVSEDCCNFDDGVNRNLFSYIISILF